MIAATTGFFDLSKRKNCSWPPLKIRTSKNGNFIITAGSYKLAFMSYPFFVYPFHHVILQTLAVFPILGVLIIKIKFAYISKLIKRMRWLIQIARLSCDCFHLARASASSALLAALSMLMSAPATKLFGLPDITTMPFTESSDSNWNFEKNWFFAMSWKIKWYRVK